MIFAKLYQMELLSIFHHSMSWINSKKNGLKNKISIKESILSKKYIKKHSMKYIIIN